MTHPQALPPAVGRAGRTPNTRELVIVGTPYILPYRVRAETVEMLRVLRGALNNGLSYN